MVRSQNHSTKAEPGARVFPSLALLSLLLYIPVQWVVGRHPGSTSIFSSQHRQLQQEFLDMTWPCANRSFSSARSTAFTMFFFPSADVPLPTRQPWLTPGCQFHRPTDVTPVEPARELACSAVIVDESLPDAWNPVRHCEVLVPWRKTGAGQHLGIREQDNLAFTFCRRKIALTPIHPRVR